MRLDISLDSQLRHFLAEYLPDDRQASPNTILAYGDTFRLLVQFLEKRTGRVLASLSVGDLNASVVQEFLDNLERERGCQVCSRNARLTAIRSFFRMLALRSAGEVAISEVLEIPVKRTARRALRFLEPAEMEGIIAAPSRSEWSGRRDHALLLTAFNTGARLSEITSLRRNQVRFNGPACIVFRGSRAGDRIVPLWLRTVQTLERWLTELDHTATDLAFPSSRGGQLSSDGVNYLLRQAVRRAAPNVPGLTLNRVTPHVLRHTDAVNFLRSGIEPEVVARWLGHRSIDAVRVYRQICEPVPAAAKPRALAAGAY